MKVQMKKVGGKRAVKIRKDAKPKKSGLRLMNSHKIKGKSGAFLQKIKQKGFLGFYGNVIWEKAKGAGADLSRAGKDVFLRASNLIEAEKVRQKGEARSVNRNRSRKLYLPLYFGWEIQVAIRKVKQRAGWIGRHYGQYMAAVGCMILAVGMGLFLQSRFTAQAATFAWSQTDWSGGEDAVNNPNHTNNQAGWTKYSAKDTGISVGTELTLASNATSTIQTTTTDFNAGTRNQTAVGSGAVTLQTNVVANAQVAAGNLHTCALRTDGTVWCWGYNSVGQLGNNSLTSRTGAVQVSNLSSVSQVGAGAIYTCALKTDGTVWCWGSNSYGQLGDNTTVNKYIPTQVSGLTGVSQISVGYYQACALKTDDTVWCWGRNDYGQLGDNTTVNKYIPTQVSGLSGTSRLAAGGYHTCALKTDGTAWCWGRNGYGQLGDNTTSNKKIPTQVSNLTDVGQMAVGSYHTCALKTDGTAWCWGYNDSGQLGDNTTVNKYIPTQVSGLMGANQVAATSENSCAQKTDGTVWCWGANGSGQLGDNTLIAKYIPVQVIGVTDSSQITLGSDYTCALRANGTVWCWGYNFWGQIGNGSTSNRRMAVESLSFANLATSGFLTNGSQISTGISFTCAAKTDGTVWCWGRNDYGQLGDNTTMDKLTPVQVSGLTGVSKIAAGGYHICAAKTDGTVWCWGRNSYGQLGDNTTITRYTPVQASGLTGVSQLAAGGTYHSCAVKTDGTAWCWGYNDSGRLGDNTTANKYVPTQVSGLTGASQITAGDGHTCAVKTDGTAWCWGYNGWGQLGDNTTVSKSVPAQASNLTSVSQVSAGTSHTCVVKSDGTGWCWGYNYYGRLGDGTTVNKIVATQVSGLTGASQIVTGDAHTCAVKTDGTAWCWGNNDYGQLGDGTTVYKSSLVQASGLTSVSQLAASNNRTCAMKTDGTLWCFGSNGYGQLGDGDIAVSYSAAQVLAAGVVPGQGAFSGVAQVSAGDNHNCTRKTDGTVWCWGYNDSGRLGDNTTFDRSAPVQVSGFTEVSQVAAGGTFACALKTDGTVWCWGKNSNGQLGDNTTVNKLTPVQVNGLTGVSQIFAGNYHACAVKTDGTAWCWGGNGSGQLGDNTTVNKLTPVQASGLTGVSQVVAGISHSCAVKTDGTGWCWGENSFGQLGDNTTVNKKVPTQVSNLTGASQVVTGGSHSCAVKTDGTAWCWGSNSNGQLGDNTMVNKKIPTQVSGLTGVSQIAAGGTHVCVVKTDGTVWCWGLNSYGRLGDNTTADKYVPTQVSGLTGASQVTAGYAHTCAVKTDGVVWCWGNNDYYQLGLDSALFPSRYTPIETRGMLMTILASSYYSSGDFVSGAIDLGQNVNFATLAFGITEPTNTDLKFQLRAASTSDGLSGATWYGPTGSSDYYTSSGTNIYSSLNGKRYVQYKAYFTTSDTAATPTLSDITFNENYYLPAATLISSPYNTQSLANTLVSIGWTESIEGGITDVKFQMRTASNSAGNPGTWSGWMGPDGTDTSYFSDPVGGETMPGAISNGVDDQWVQYKVWLTTTDGSKTPTLSDVTVTYVVNVPPDFNVNYPTSGAGGVGVTAASSNVINISYAVRDTDTDTAGVSNRYKIWPTFDYSLDNGSTWNAITSQYLGATDLSEKAVQTINYNTYSATWDAAGQLGSNTYTTNALIRVTSNDHEAANNMANATSTAFVLDTKAPTAGMPTGGGSGININQNVLTSLGSDKTASSTVTLYLSASDNSAFEMVISNDGVFDTESYEPYSATKAWNLTDADGTKTVYVKFKDAYGNVAGPYTDTITRDAMAPAVPGNLFIQDISNASSTTEGEFRLFLSWNKSTESDCKDYKVYRDTGSGYTLYQTITDIDTNYLVQMGLSGTTTYSYKLAASDDILNVSASSTAMIMQPGTSNPTDKAKPEITGVGAGTPTSSSAAISWVTNELTTSKVLYSIDTNYGSERTAEGYVTSHMVTLAGLVANTAYNYKVESCDPAGNCTTSEAGQFTTALRDSQAPGIGTISFGAITQRSAIVNWMTTEYANSYVEYSTSDVMTDSAIYGDVEMTSNHSVMLPATLTPNTTYYIKVHSTDLAGNEAVSGTEHFATLATASDTKAPVITNIQATNIQPNTAIITWVTDEAASSYVEFGVSGAYGRVYGQNDLTTGHSVELPKDLVAGTVYHYRVRSIDGAGNEGISNENTFTTAAATGDTTAPTISAVAIADPGQTGVTITWTTNEAANSYVGYSKDKSYLLEQGNAELTTTHGITLVGLLPATQYYFRIKSSDASGNTATDTNSGSYTFTTSAGSVPPVISGIQIVNVTSNQATIQWNTDMAADSFVEYGVTGSYGIIAGDSEDTLAHSVTLTGLLSQTTYHFRVRSTASTEAVSAEMMFTTGQSAASDTAALAITDAAVLLVNDTSAVISWTTNKLATSQLSYGTSNSFGTNTAEDASLVYKHMVTLNDLSRETKYYYKVISKDGANNQVDDSNGGAGYTFTTTKEPGQAATVVVAGGGGGGTSDTVAPKLNNIQAQGITDNSSRISWATNENSSSIVEIGADESYGLMRGSYDERTNDHRVEITDLVPQTLYHFRAISFDRAGNMGRSEDRTFKTTGNARVEAVKLEDVPQKDRGVIENIAAKIEQLVSPRSLDSVAQVLEESANKVISAPVITGNDMKVLAGPNTVKISWMTDQKSNSLVAFGRSSNYGMVVGNAEEMTTSHKVEITGLEAGTMYHYQIRSKSNLGPVAKSEDKTFKTTNLLPEFFDINFEKISASQVDLTWRTNIPCASVVNYVNLSDEKKQQLKDGQYLRDHKLELKELVPDVNYSLTIEAKDESANTAISPMLTFSTGVDTVAPQISQVKTDTAISPKGDKVQTIISWMTDEPATSKVTYHEGAGKNAGSEITIEDKTLTRKHVLIAAFKPATVYMFKAQSQDASGNLGTSNDFTVLTPQQRRTVVQMIMENFGKTFGWMRR